MFSDPTSLSGSKYCPISYPWPHSGKCCIHPVDSGSCEKHEVYYEKELISAEKSISCPECTKPPSNQCITLIVIAYNISYARTEKQRINVFTFQCIAVAMIDWMIQTVKNHIQIAHIVRYPSRLAPVSVFIYYTEEGQTHTVQVYSTF